MTTVHPRELINFPSFGGISTRPKTLFSATPLVNTAGNAADTVQFSGARKTADVADVKNNAPKLLEPARRRLVVIANREPFSINGKNNTAKVQAGGLVSGMSPSLQEGDLWICGEVRGENKDNVRFNQMQAYAKEHGIEIPPYEVSGVTLSAEENDGFYKDIANDALWPVSHNSLPEYSNNLEANWQLYDRVNRKFANKALRETGNDDMIWVQDYHFLLVPGYISAKDPNRNVGFFSHIPFPSYDHFRTLPHQEDIVRGMLGADLVGFHTEDYAKNFMDAVANTLGDAAKVNYDTGVIDYAGRQVKVGVFPISIDSKGFMEKTQSAEIQARAREMKTTLAARGIEHIGIGIDRLDYSKGIPERLKAIEVFLERNPEYIGKFQFFQIAAPSRSGIAKYDRVANEVYELVGKINGKFATPTWQPIVFMNRNVPPSDWLPVSMISNFSLINPHKDGMNLVAKEYCMTEYEDAETGRKRNGVLILSNQAGAAHELKDALQVNPHNPEDMALAIKAALEMPEEEKEHRMANLRDQILENDIHFWRERFLTQFEQVTQNQKVVQDVTQALTPGDETKLAMFDYDGTLTPMMPRPQEAQIVIDRVEILNRLLNNPNTKVAVVSGRSVAQLRKFLWPLEGKAITLVGLHGSEAFDMEKGEWLYKADEHAKGIVDELQGGLSDMEARYPGVQLENKGYTLAVHYRNLENRDQLLALKNELNMRLSTLNKDAQPKFRLKEGKQVLEFAPASHDKGKAVSFLKKHFGVKGKNMSFFGDDLTDEDAFRVVNRVGGTSVRVGEKTPGVDSAAGLHLLNTQSVFDAIQGVLKSE